MFQQMRRSGFAVRLVHGACPITDVNGNRGAEMPLQHEQPETILEGKGLNLFRQLIGKKGGGEKKRQEEENSQGCEDDARDEWLFAKATPPEKG